VACACGTRDDDGERMAACDACAAWAHTRCAGVADGAPVPPLFLCAACHRAAAAAGGAAAGAAPPPEGAATVAAPDTAS
jgi:PHD-finger